MFTIRLKDNSLVEGLSVAQIRKMASTGFISSEDMVQRIGTSTWTRAGNIPGLTFAEVSDGSISLNHDKKCEYIQTLSKQVTVLSEVGSKDAAKIIPPYKWIEQMQTELSAGAWKVIGEAREGGNVGLFRDSGEVRQGLVEEILTQVPEEKIIWEAPQKSQQVWFIKLLGANVNLGNISPAEIIPLETIRLGLRGDTFDHFLGEIKL